MHNETIQPDVQIFSCAKIYLASGLCSDPLGEHASYFTNLSLELHSPGKSWKTDWNVLYEYCVS